MSLPGTELLRQPTNNSRLEVDEHGTGNMFPGSGLAEEGVEGVVAASDGLVRGHLAIGLDAVLQAVQLPACIAHLDSGLADVDRDTFTLPEKKMTISKQKAMLLERFITRNIYNWYQYLICSIFTQTYCTDSLYSKGIQKYLDKKKITKLSCSVMIMGMLKYYQNLFSRPSANVYIIYALKKFYQ